jgi:hypothetical protein
MLRRRHGGGRLLTRVWGAAWGNTTREAEAEAEKTKGIAASFEMERPLICRLAYLLAGEVDELCLSSVSPVRPTTERWKPMQCFFFLEGKPMPCLALFLSFLNFFFFLFLVLLICHLFCKSKIHSRSLNLVQCVITIPKLLKCIFRFLNLLIVSYEVQIIIFNLQSEKYFKLCGTYIFFEIF